MAFLGSFYSMLFTAAFFPPKSKIRRKIFSCDTAFGLKQAYLPRFVGKSFALRNFFRHEVSVIAHS